MLSRPLVLNSFQATAKAEHLLEKAEKKEQSCLMNLHKAENAHNVALSNVTQAQSSYEVFQWLMIELDHSPHHNQASARRHAKTRESLQKKTVRINEAIKANEEQTVRAAIYHSAPF